MCFGKGLGEDSVANLSEKVSLTRRVREGAWDSRGSPPPAPPSALLLLLGPGCCRVGGAGGHPAPGFNQDTGTAGQELGYLSGPGSPAPEPHGGGSSVCGSEAGWSADSPGASGASFSQVLINDNVPPSNQAPLCLARVALEWKGNPTIPTLGAARSPTHAPDLWLLGPGDGREPGRQWGHRSARQFYPAWSCHAS